MLGKVAAPYNLRQLTEESRLFSTQQRLYAAGTIDRIASNGDLVVSILLAILRLVLVNQPVSQALSRPSYVHIISRASFGRRPNAGVYLFRYMITLLASFGSFNGWLNQYRHD